ncbi:hypothetical protein ISG33_11095 [Glaciecola sp. MH2013]|uniref:hypothetical protein n=1 Tax=Glaciecola sp. MH2013 TaxID=2785524 RepID=UPI00189FD7CB|nr:hypothetical protein [Glaciecola sp. MH2013]MBF7073945.1 hypothetical protein [Glaciecola sp. MH2013]
MAKKIRHKYLDSLNLVEVQIHGKLDFDDFDDVFSQKFESIWILADDASKFSQVTEKLKHVKAIRYNPYEKQDVTWINELPNLEYIYLSGPLKGTVDFNNFKNAREVHVDICKTTKSILTSSISPEYLGLHKFKGDLEKLPKTMLNSVRSLYLSSTNLEHLDGLSEFSELDELVIERNLKLTNIEGLSAQSKLKFLHIESCNKIDDYSVLSLLTVLEKFSFYNKVMPTLQLLTSKLLASIELGPSTKLQDLDTGYFINFPSLTYVGFYNRKDYFKKLDEVKSMLDIQS